MALDTDYGRRKFAQVKVRMWAYAAQFGLKKVVSPTRPASLDYPTTYGHNANGKIDGALLLPAMLVDVNSSSYGMGLGSSVCASARFTLTAEAIETDVTIGIQPFKES